ncbi:PKD domain-containing protein, partial [Enterobacter hormaechei]|uniref:PKD domain-containing protein n=1 Tax=Enterobacter hormaechei TaxID=158836 RepID=UPI0013D734C2
MSDTLVCAGNTVLFTNTTVNSNNYTYTWNFGNGTIMNSAHPSSIRFTGSVSGKDTSYT